MSFGDLIAKLDSFAWGPLMLILLVGTGIYLSVRVGFIQFTHFHHAMKNTVGKMFKKQKAGKGEVTPFQAVTTVDNIKFKGYVKDFAIQMQDNDVWRATITIKGSGQRTVTKATP